MIPLILNIKKSNTLIYNLILFAVFVAIVSPTLAMYDNGDVVELTDSNFDRLVIRSDEVWVVEFYAPWCGHCQSLAPEYKKLASALKGIVKVGALNADEHKSTGAQYGVRGFPTIKVFGDDKKKPIAHEGQRTARAMADAALNAVKAKITSNLGGSASSSGGSKSSDKDEVIELTDANFDKLVLQSDDVWLVEFFAPWCGHCKNLAPEWAKAAKELKGKSKVGSTGCNRSSGQGARIWRSRLPHN